MGWSCFCGGGRVAAPSILSPLFLRRKRLSMPVGDRSPDSAPKLATDTHTDAHFNKFKLNLSCVCDGQFPSRIRFSASTNIINIKGYTEQRVKCGGRGFRTASNPAYTNNCFHLRPSQSFARARIAEPFRAGVRFFGSSAGRSSRVRDSLVNLGIAYPQTTMDKS
jgi:hypothetical protein